ncbi:Fur family transcriptional regulator [Janibacter cremeus]|uniref:Fur family transcriptional regulator n=1 Tax=Janibacter cremeus TaxID=1285192 RepID=UPI0023FA2664|nr:Fur family transcriptional regulator [Janibacter cremeus]WEV77693.1 Fur family transcriptional regulator [Janibacter cremeus]
MDDPGEVLRRHGLRMTEQRRRVLGALTRRSHLTPDSIAALVATDGGPELPPSTIYRTLDALEEVGLVEHTHLDHRAPTYHRAGRHGHLHLRCRDCGRVTEVDPALATPFADAVRGTTGFVADLTHMAIHGRCADCAGDTDTEGGA